MKVKYDKEVDATYIQMSSQKTEGGAGIAEGDSIALLSQQGYSSNAILTLKLS